jgi:hypothetical protein
MQWSGTIAAVAATLFAIAPLKREQRDGSRTAVE